MPCLLLPPLFAVGANGPAPVLEVPPWSAVPFVLTLLAIALLPLVAEHFWHANRNKALVLALLAAPVVGFLVHSGLEYTHALLHALEEYASFIILLGSLYTVSGGIVVRGDIEGRPLTNTALLAAGAVLANLIGTTGASMLLIRPFLRINRQRQHVRHLPVFFIFVVSNLGGLLTPLGDPPLFLGFLRGVDFFWTLSLWREWLVVNGAVLAVFFVWDSLAHFRESKEAIARDVRESRPPLRVEGLRNLLFLGGIVAAVLLKSPHVGRLAGDWLGRFFPCPDLTLHPPWGDAVMAAMGLLALLLTPRRLREANGFRWGPIVEVAVLFAGIFVCMVPALELLKKHSGESGIEAPWQFFWLTGALSSFLDNAPTYLAFATLAAGKEANFGWLVEHRPDVLAAISCGAVFMGANTYIGNGPNFMVKAIADEAGIRMPSFFGYMVYAGLILLPLFVLVTFVFFPPGG